MASVGSTSTRANLEDYIAKFSANARQVFEHFAFDRWLEKLEKANLLYLVAQKFAAVDLHPDKISNHEMGLVFEHLIRKFAESSNDDAGQYFTPRDVVRLEEALSDHLGTRVSLKIGAREKGQIVIDFHGWEHLNSLLERQGLSGVIDA